MKSSLSLVVITKNAEKYLNKTLSSVNKLADEKIVIDDYSTDNTVKIAKKYRAKIFLHHDRDLGKQRAYGLKKVTKEWVLILDADEWLSNNLRKEIVKLLNCYIVKYDAYWIPFQTHFLGKPLHYGGENYNKLRLFKKDAVIVKPSLVHEQYRLIKGKAGYLKNKVYHYSYQSIASMFKKFTDYAKRTAEEKINNNEKTSLKKIILYPIHMFWARFIKDKGYRDGLFRIPLDLGFAYMEFLTYSLMLFMTRQSKFYHTRVSPSLTGSPRK